MKTLSYTESRANYAQVLDDVVNNREETIITRAGHEPVVIVSLADYESLRETAYLLRLFAAPPTTLPFAACFPRLESEDLSRAMSMLLQLAAQGVVGVSAQPLQGAPTGERPVATRLAQDDALSGAKFTANRLHHAIEIGDLPRFLLPLLDGTRSAEDCVALLLDAARAGVVRLQEADGALAEGDRAQELAAMLVAGGLDSIAACGLLEL